MFDDSLETAPAHCCQTVLLELLIFKKLIFASQSDDPANGNVLLLRRFPPRPWGGSGFLLQNIL